MTATGGTALLAELCAEWERMKLHTYSHAEADALIERLFARAGAAERECREQRDGLRQVLATADAIEGERDALQARVAALEHCVAAGVTYHNSIQVPHGCSCDWCQIARPLLK